MMIRVLVADDHAMFREMLKIALPRGGGLEVVGEAADGIELADVIYRVRPDVVLLDYQMPPLTKNFTDRILSVREQYSTTQVIVLSGFASEEIARRAAAGGAHGYVLKSTRLAAVADAIRAVASGGVWVDPNLPRKIFEIFQRDVHRGPQTDGMADLTRREREVLACVAEGISNHEIAQKLCISEQTVKTHLTRIFAKLSVKNRLAAALAFYGKDSRRESPRPVS